MKIKIYLRIANKTGKGKVAVKASTKPDYSPIEGAKVYGSAHGTFYSTVAFAIEVDIPEEAFKQAEKVVAILKLKEEELKINEIKVLEKNEQ